MGLDNVPEEQRSYSSKYNEDNLAKSILFQSYSHCWVPNKNLMAYSEENSAVNWLILDLKRPKFVKGVAIQSGYSNENYYWLRKFRLKYSSRYDMMIDFDMDVDNGKELINPSNKGWENEYSTINFDTVIKTRYLKLIPTYWKSVLKLRVGVF